MICMLSQVSACCYVALAQLARAVLAGPRSEGGDAQGPDLPDEELPVAAEVHVHTRADRLHCII